MTASLFDANGQRLYITASERNAFLEATSRADRQIRTFCMVMAYTGCRISEALALTGKSIDFGQKAIVFETLKKRKAGVYRAVPVPDSLLDTLNMAHGLQEAAKRKKNRLGLPLWDFSRTTAWRHIVEVMNQAHIPDGPHKCPKGLRHGFGVMAITQGIPLNMVSKWMGHASLEVTAIYANALGEEQRTIAGRMWG
ncbi:site-specific integrase [bacterium]|nr:site-specific integrase [bacterium]